MMLPRLRFIHMGGSTNGATPKWMVWNVNSIYKWTISGPPRKPPYVCWLGNIFISDDSPFSQDASLQQDQWCIPSKNSHVKGKIPSETKKKCGGIIFSGELFGCKKTDISGCAICWANHQPNLGTCHVFVVPHVYHSGTLRQSNGAPLKITNGETSSWGEVQPCLIARG